LNGKKRTEIHKVYLNLGSNIAPQENLARAIALLRETVKVETISSVWETPPAGGEGPNFLNAVALVYTLLSADDLKYLVLGRVRTDNPYDPRSIDLDILIFDGRVVDEEVWRHAHHAVPLAELIPEFVHKESGETLSQIARRLAEATPIRTRGES
jgi:2-amino-4-hydroxy-6-hydroxymethyldihydropteridine diphosphokinase